MSDLADITKNSAAEWLKGSNCVVYWLRACKHSVS